MTTEYRPISITRILSKAFPRLLDKRLYVYLRPFLPETRFGFIEGLGCIMQYAFDKAHESRLVSLDFSAAFDTVNQKGLIFKLQSVGGKFLSIINIISTGYVYNDSMCIELLKKYKRYILCLLPLDLSEYTSWDNVGTVLNQNIGQK